MYTGIFKVGGDWACIVIQFYYKSKKKNLKWKDPRKEMSCVNRKYTAANHQKHFGVFGY